MLVLPYINMNSPQVYTCSPSWTLLPPPSPYHFNPNSVQTLDISLALSRPPYLPSCISLSGETRALWLSQPESLGGSVLSLGPYSVWPLAGRIATWLPGHSLSPPPGRPCLRDSGPKQTKQSNLVAAKTSEWSFTGLLQRRGRESPAL